AWGAARQAAVAAGVPCVAVRDAPAAALAAARGAALPDVVAVAAASAARRDAVAAAPSVVPPGVAPAAAAAAPVAPSPAPGPLADAARACAVVAPRDALPAAHKRDADSLADRPFRRAMDAALRALEVREAGLEVGPAEWLAARLVFRIGVPAFPAPSDAWAAQ